MAFLVSPGVQVKERDLTNIIPAVSTSIGGFAGVAEWGPALEATTVSSEADLIAQFGYPRLSSVAGSNTRSDWYAAANFLGYANNLQFVRVLPDGARNAASESVIADTNSISAVLTGTAPSTPAAMTVAYDGTTTVTFTPAIGSSLDAIANAFDAALKTAGITGVSIDSEGIPLITDPTILYSSSGIDLPATQTVSGVTFSFFQNTELEADVIATTSASIKNLNDFLIEQTTLVNGSVYARYPGKLGNSIGIMLVDALIDDSDFQNTVVIGDATTLKDIFNTIPKTSVWAETAFGSAMADEMHVVVYTTDTQITGNSNEILETYAYVSKAKNAKTADGAQNYYVDVINTASKWIYIRNEETAAQNPVVPYAAGTKSVIGKVLSGSSEFPFAQLLTNIGLAGIRKHQMNGGSNGTVVTDANYMAAYDIMQDVETVDVSLLITGERSKTVQKYVIEIANTRKDCIAFVSPDYTSAVTAPTAKKITEYFNNSVDGFNSTSYAVFDSGWKRQYDRYNDEYFWAPLNADIAGLSARTDYTNEAWYSPAGLNRGFIKNVVKLSFNPTQTDRDTLYPLRVNPVVTLRGQGTLLYGDKTALSRPSAFDRINVRRLFIVLQKAIATAAKYQLFEFNDDLTRRLFVNAVEPFLADIKSKRGLTDFKVVCDGSNNTGEVVDGNRFVADIYIKPTRSINFITLNFTAVRTGVAFSEVAGS